MIKKLLFAFAILAIALGHGRHPSIFCPHFNKEYLAAQFKCTQDSECLNGATCAEGTCKCADGYYGVFCEAYCPNDCGYGHEAGYCSAHLQKCKCYKYNSGYACSGPNGKCPNNCGQTGNCVDGKCKCADGWMGDDCGTMDTRCGECQHGHCHGAHECHCDWGWKGKTCNEPNPDQPTCENNDCHGNGHCWRGTCKCLPGYGGENCKDKTDPEVVCKGHDNSPCNYRGSCREGKCKCVSSRTGQFCEKDKPRHKCETKCGPNEWCSIFTGKCECSYNYKKDEDGKCTLPRCTVDCYGPDHGDCVFKKRKSYWGREYLTTRCECKNGYKGWLCWGKPCPAKCVNGRCGQEGTCECDFGYKGPTCEEHITCKEDCGANGYCYVSSDYTTVECRCNNHWTGDNCEKPL